MLLTNKVLQIEVPSAVPAQAEEGEEAAAEELPEFTVAEFQDKVAEALELDEAGKEQLSLFSTARGEGECR